MKTKFDIPKNAKYVLENLNNMGYDAYLVGGCVRDYVMGIIPTDYDITTSATPDEIKKVFRHTADTGIKHGTVTVIPPVGEPCEVTTFRCEYEYVNNRKPSKVDFVTNLKEDLKRRDFTINAMAYNDKVGIIDLYGGLDDIKNGVIKCVGDPNERFTEDALRMLRAVRFSCKLGFYIEGKVLESIKNNSRLIQNISSERIKAELEKSIMSDHAKNLIILHKTGLSNYIMPWFDLCLETKQNTPYHIYDVGNHILKTVEYAKKDPVVRWAAFLHDVGKPACKTTDENGVDHFKGHETKSAEIARSILNNLKFDNKSKEKIILLIKNHRWSRGTDAVSVRCTISEVGKENFRDLVELMRADSLAHSEESVKRRIGQIEIIEKVYKQILKDNDPLCIKDLAVNGRDLGKMGISGEKTGIVLKRMLQLVLKKPQMNNREELLKRARGFL